MAKKVIHSVPGIPNENWTILESNGRFIPKLAGQHLMRWDGKSASIAWFTAMEDATRAVLDVIGRAQ